MKTAFALVDCNNFYASCEKLFRPDLKHTPVVVLSNNDGCIVARSKEVKALGVKMGVPMFQVQEEIIKHGIVCFSSNYALYADLSNRVMAILEEDAPRLEVYSIDEAFMDLNGLDQLIDLQTFGKQIKRKVDKWTGITVGVGIAPTKTLAKLANHAAKHYPATGSVVNLMNPDRQKRLLALLDASDVWGVGRRMTSKLKEKGINTALDLANANPKAIRNEFSVVLERTVRELNGISCLDLECIRPTKQQIICSRSFGYKVTDKQQLREAIAKYMTRAAEKLRGEKRLCRVVSVFIRTSPFMPNEPRYAKSLSAELPYPTADTRDLLDVADALFHHIYRAGFRYAKGGVMLSDFYEHNAFQRDLFQTDNKKINSTSLMKTVDSINRSKHGKIFFAAEGISPKWTMKREHLSPAYTTKWADLPKVY